MLRIKPGNPAHTPEGSFTMAATLKVAGAIFALSWPCIAAATLGGSADTVETDRSALRASVKVTAQSLYQVHELQLPSGTTLREFVAPGGTVFALAWRGPAIPNLRQALGSYFNPYAAAVGARHGGRGHLEVKSGDLVVRGAGHMRSFSGVAYLASAIPAGIAVEDLK